MVGMIISGGQTGVDRAALDVAIELGIPCGGWCPKGRKAEDGPLDFRYPLEETNSADYRVRTEKNISFSDGTLILTEISLSGGTALTAQLAQRKGKPCLIVDLGKKADEGKLEWWVNAIGIKVLNVAGPRESKCPGIYERAKAFLRKVFQSNKR
jgi:hypothetical protein